MATPIPDPVLSPSEEPNILLQANNVIHHSMSDVIFPGHKDGKLFIWNFYIVLSDGGGPTRKRFGVEIDFSRDSRSSRFTC